MWKMICLALFPILHVHVSNPHTLTPSHTYTLPHTLTPSLTSLTPSLLTPFTSHTLPTLTPFTPRTLPSSHPPLLTPSHPHTLPSSHPPSSHPPPPLLTHPLLTPSLHSHPPSSHPPSSQCVAYIVAAELPAGQWPDIIAGLLLNVSGTSNTEAVKEASLEAIGYICEELVSCNN